MKCDYTGNNLSYWE